MTEINMKDPQQTCDKETNSHSYSKLCVLNDALLAVFSTVGAVHRVYDVHEVCRLKLFYFFHIFGS